MRRHSARDFKSARPRRDGAARWQDFAMGLVAGVVVGAMGWAFSHQGQHTPVALDAPKPEAHKPPPEARAEGMGSAPQHYDFYSMLPNFEVVVPEKETAVKRDLPAAKIEKPGAYVLQAGSYRNEGDADRVARQLNLQGIDAKVQRVALDADVWFRVRVGPISDLAQLNRVRRQLQAADVDALVIRVGD
ncbi:MAG TPA: SPOR domain-containing protein [Steroidobacteraceae bacterium]|nr:SPOR domain-containing protein [Steroidobacteraceae bacterium]